MSKRQFFLGILLASLIGGIVALAGLSFLVQPQNATSFDEKQQASFVNLLSGEDFTVPDGINFVASAEAVVPAVVHVKSQVSYTSRGRSQRDPIQEYFGIPPRDNQGGGSQQGPTTMSSGSGVIISPDGYIVTNNHVVENATRLEISLDNNKRYTAKVIGTDPTTDLALLKIDAEGLPFVRFGDSDKTKIGEWVLAVGNPFDLNSTVTAGIISAKARNIRILDNNLAIEAFLQTDAVVNPGNSGGALVNLAGELIGINTAIASSTGTFSGYSFAVPSTLVKKVMDDLMQYGTAQRALLGVSILNVSPELSDQLGYELPVEQGVYIGSVNEKSGGEEAGLKQGDIIISLDGKVTNSVATLQEMVARKRPGDKVEVEYLRDGKANKTKVTLKNFSGTTDIVKKVIPKTYAFQGVNFEEVPDTVKEQLKLSGGALIASVSGEKWRRSGARPGFIITSIMTESGRKKISDVENLLEVLEDTEGEDIVVLGMFQDGTEYYFEID
ncbi:S1C family serine protease [Algoriphagus aquimarinus]|uniref:Do/DeqQ family serine protease n=1 Tax=Algoriphagus aquimarinus TaxID=237018 RepID=A0A1I0Z081_9BACT|nr:trypsin-like peptidase domain-containing protein [Algoriphagus aquimarinus]SFB19099.1 Do/DeqQ family serine protease [Algoriphagus aquimarinus]|tara:strand:+ start:92841 stop:94337 length:1497 start_codon:yes stop_codon:yes gene_type:complete